jgi:hypothetical protein
LFTSDKHRQQPLSLIHEETALRNSKLYYNYISQNSGPFFGWLHGCRSTATVTCCLNRLALCDLSISLLYPAPNRRLRRSRDGPIPFPGTSSRVMTSVPLARLTLPFLSPNSILRPPTPRHRSAELQDFDDLLRRPHHKRDPMVTPYPGTSTAHDGAVVERPVEADFTTAIRSRRVI